MYESDKEEEAYKNLVWSKALVFHSGLDTRHRGTFVYVVAELYAYASKDEDFYILHIWPLLKRSNGVERQPVVHDFMKLINKISIDINHMSKSIKFGPIGNIIFSQEVRGMGLGSYCMSELIRIIKAKYGEYTIKDGKLGITDVMNMATRKVDEELVEKRNNFYKHHGFSIKSSDNGVTGSFYIEDMNSLQEYCSYSRHIKGYSIKELGRKLLTYRRKYSDIRTKYDSLETLKGKVESSLLEYKKKYYRLVWINILIAVFIAIYIYKKIII